MAPTDTRPEPISPFTRVAVRFSWGPSLAYAVVFAAGAAILLLEITAGRLLAPALGVSLETWTGIIGVVLTGFALGDLGGGRLADRVPTPRFLAVVLGLAGIAVIMTVPLAGHFGGILLGSPVLVRVTAVSVGVLLVPCTLLGAVLPVTTRLTLRSTAEAGRTAGGLSAVSTASSVLGVAVGGFLLLEHLGVRTIIVAAGVALLGLAVLPFLARMPARAAPGGTGEPAGGDLQRERMLVPLLLAASGGAGVMMVELAGARIAAPLLGSSLYTWASVIGATLLGISLGNALGGRLADRRPSPALLGGALGLAGAASLGVLLLPYLYSRVWPGAMAVVLSRLPPSISVPLLIGAMLLPPATAFGALSPIIIRLTLRRVDVSGRLVGRIYAAQAAGSIAGTFAAGFALVSLLGARALILLVAQGMVLLGVLVAGADRRAVRPVLRRAAAGAFLLAVVAAAAGWVPSPCLRESNYYCIRILDLGDDRRALALDSLIHSYVDVGRPQGLTYDYELGWAVLADDVAARRAAGGGAGPLRALFIGGGGYAFPRYLERLLPDARLEVVEIDPAVTAVTHAELGLPRTTAIRTWNEDGRQFFLRRPRDAYDLVLLDVFRDAYSIPAHLTTREFAGLVAAALTPDGVYAVNIVDGRVGRFVRSYARTLQEVFPYVYLLPAGADWRENVQTIFVLFASPRPLDLGRIMRRQPPGLEGGMSLVPLAPEALAAFLAAGPSTVLTDDRAPVEQFLARVYAQAMRQR